MRNARFGIALLVVGVLVALGGFAYVLDHLRASVRVTDGLGDAMEALAEESAQAASDAEMEIAPDAALPSSDGAVRSAVPVEEPEPRDLEVRIVTGDSKAFFWAEVLAYRGDELVRVGHPDGRGCAHLIPFTGSGSVRVEHMGDELARQDIAEGHGRVTIVVRRTETVAGVARVGGVPRGDVRLMLYSGPPETWLSSLVQRPLWSLGLQERSTRFGESTDSQGRFRYVLLKPDWSGVLEIEDTKQYRFADGSTSLVLTRPDDALQLDLEEVEPARPELVIRGRVVFHGEAMAGARYRSRPKTRGTRMEDPETGRCDELGGFSITPYTDEWQALTLEFSKPGVGVRTLELHGAEIRADLGDIELEPTHPIPFVVRTPSGEPLAGVRALPKSEGDPGSEHDRPFRFPNDWNVFASEPTDAEGRGVLHLRPGSGRILVGARRYATLEVDVPDAVDTPLAITLSRACALEVKVRDSADRISRGLSLHLDALTAPFTWKNGAHPDVDEIALGAQTHWPFDRDDGRSNLYWLGEDGSVWISDLRSGAHFDLTAVDSFGAQVAAARELVLEPGEWRSLVLHARVKARTVLVFVHDAFGRPIPSVTLKVTPIGVPESPMGQNIRLTDRAGMAKLDWLYSSDVKLRAERSGFEARTIEHLLIPAEGATVEIRLAHDWSKW